MLEAIASRIKVSLLLVLFFSPVIAAVFDKQLDEWIHANHFYEALKVVNAGGGSR